MLVLPLVFAVAIVVAVVLVQRHGHQTVHAGAAPRGPVGPTSAEGRWSLVVLAGALAIYALTFSSLPIWYVATLGFASFTLAAVAYRRAGDHAPALLLPLILVPLAATLTIAFVLLS